MPDTVSRLTRGGAHPASAVRRARGRTGFECHCRQPAATARIAAAALSSRAFDRRPPSEFFASFALPAGSVATLASASAAVNNSDDTGRTRSVEHRSPERPHVRATVEIAHAASPPQPPVGTSPDPTRLATRSRATGRTPAPPDGPTDPGAGRPAAPRCHSRAARPRSARRGEPSADTGRPHGVCETPLGEARRLREARHRLQPTRRPVARHSRHRRTRAQVDPEDVPAAVSTSRGVQPRPDTGVDQHRPARVVGALIQPERPERWRARRGHAWRRRLPRSASPTATGDGQARVGPLPRPPPERRILRAGRVTLRVVRHTAQQPSEPVPIIGPGASPTRSAASPAPCPIRYATRTASDPWSSSATGRAHRRAPATAATREHSSRIVPDAPHPRPTNPMLDQRPIRSFLLAPHLAVLGRTAPARTPTRPHRSTSPDPAQTTPPPGLPPDDADHANGPRWSTTRTSAIPGVITTPTCHSRGPPTTPHRRAPRTRPERRDLESSHVSGLEATRRRGHHRPAAAHPS